MKIIDLTKETESIKIIVSASKLSFDVNQKNPEIGEVLITTQKDPFDLVLKSWDEYEEKYKLVTGYHRYFHCNKLQEFTHNVILEKISIFANSSQEANAFIALMQLRMLWHEWVKVLGEPTENEHYCIGWRRVANRLCVTTYNGALTFKEKEHADKFIECFGELLEQAKILI